MTIKIDNQEPNIFPLVEGIDVRDTGRSAEVIFATKVEGQLARQIGAKLSRLCLPRRRPYGGFNESEPYSSVYV
jgi:hypothetical protein